MFFEYLSAFDHSNTESSRPNPKDRINIKLVDQVKNKNERTTDQNPKPKNYKTKSTVLNLKFSPIYT